MLFQYLSGVALIWKAEAPPIGKVLASIAVHAKLNTCYMLQRDTRCLLIPKLVYYV